MQLIQCVILTICELFMRINTLLLYDNFYDQDTTPKMPFCQYNCKADFGGLIYLSMNGLIYLSAIGDTTQPGMEY